MNENELSNMWLFGNILISEFLREIDAMIALTMYPNAIKYTHNKNTIENACI